MLRRHPCLVRALSATGLLALSTLAGPIRADEPLDPVPGAEATAQNVEILQAERDGDITLDVRGHGDDQVRVTVHNVSPRRLNVVLPPGLVASAASAQFGGFQSMGLGTPTAHRDSFGAFHGDDHAGFRSVAVEGKGTGRAITVSTGQTVEFELPAVCLNFGLPTPTPKNQFRLMDVDDYTPDARARKALRSLATIGTSHGVAQAVAWNVFNGLSFPQMAVKAAKYINIHEIALASRFVEVLDASGSSDLVESVYLNQARLFVRVRGEGLMTKDAARLAGELGQSSLLGLPVRVVDEAPSPESYSSAMFLDVVLTGGKPGETRGRIFARYRTPNGQWGHLGNFSFAEDQAVSDLDGANLSRTVGRTVASALVNVRPLRRSTGATVVRVENRMPFSIAHLTLRTDLSDDTGSVQFDGVGIGPGRSTTVTIPAASAIAEQVEFNGL